MTNGAKSSSPRNCNPATTGLHHRAAATPARHVIARTMIDAPEIVIVVPVIAVLVIAVLSGAVLKDVAVKIVARPVAALAAELVALEAAETLGLTSARRMAIKAQDPSMTGSLAWSTSSTRFCTNYVNSAASGPRWGRWPIGDRQACVEWQAVRRIPTWVRLRWLT